MAAAIGRPSKLTEDVKKKLLQAIRAGNYYEPACYYAGIQYSTLRNWVVKGQEAGSGEFFDFLEELKKAEAEAEARMVAQWQNQMPEDWKAIATFLERRHPDRWGRKQAHTISGPDGGAIRVNVDAEAKEQLLNKLHSLIAKAGADGVDE